MKPTIKHPDFERLDLRVGKVVEASLPEWSEKLVKYRVDFGVEIGERIMFSGIRAWYKPKDLENKKFIFVLNMEKKKMGEEFSEGMMIMADTEDKPIIMPVSDEIEIGVVVR